MTKEKFKIMVCDDSLLVRYKMKKLLEELGEELGDFNIIEANDGQMAIDIFEVENPNLVFLDFVMPRKNGLEALVGIKNINPDVPVVMISSAGTIENVQDTMERGALKFIQKPCSKEQIKTILKQVLSLGEVK